MHFQTKNLPPNAAYKLLSGSVVPRPIALVTSHNEEGTVNAAPFSFFNVLGSDPPIVALGIGNRDAHTPKDSARNIAARGEFVVNLVAREMADAMNLCATDFPPEISEIEIAGLQTAPSQLVGMPRIENSPVSLECVLNQILHIGNNRLVLGEVVAFHFAPDLVDETTFRVRTERLNLVGRMGGAGGYVETSATFEMPRVSYEEWLKKERKI